MKTTKTLAAALFAAAMLTGCASHEVGMTEKKGACCADGSAAGKACCTEAGTCTDGTAKTEGQCCETEKKAVQQN
jgi:hypothetical protein